jgi:hypothetical protein
MYKERKIHENLVVSFSLMLSSCFSVLSLCTAARPAFFPYFPLMVSDSPPSAVTVVILAVRIE